MAAGGEFMDVASSVHRIPANLVLNTLSFAFIDRAAYAYVNSWNSVYQKNYYKFPGVQTHEIG